MSTSLRVVLGAFVAASVVAVSAEASADPLGCLSDPDLSGADGGASGVVIEGAVTEVSPFHLGHLRAADSTAAASTCLAPAITPIVLDPALSYHFTSHEFQNFTGAPACVTIDAAFRPCDYLQGECAPPPDPTGACATGGCGGVGYHEVAAYAGAFDYLDPSVGYLGDNGRNVGGPSREVFSVTVPAGAKFYVVVTWAGPVAPRFEPRYRLTVSGCGSSGTAPDAGIDADGGSDGGSDAGATLPNDPAAPPPGDPGYVPPPSPGELPPATPGNGAGTGPRDGGAGRKTTTRPRVTGGDEGTTFGCSTTPSSGGVPLVLAALGAFSVAAVVRRRRRRC